MGQMTFRYVCDGDSGWRWDTRRTKKTFKDGARETTKKTEVRDPATEAAGTSTQVEANDGILERGSESARQFLPRLLDLLRRRPNVEKPVGVVLQYRGFEENNKSRYGVLATVQEIDIPAWTSSGENSLLRLAPKLFAPAVYVEEELNDITREYLNMSFKQMIGGEFKPKGGKWSIDVVLRLHMIDEQRDVRNNKGYLVATVETIAPCKEQKFRGDHNQILNAWQPDGGREEEFGVFDDCVCLPWVPPFGRFDLEDIGGVLYLLNTSGARATLKNISSCVWQSPNLKNVLVYGDSGAGKEVVSRLIHAGRARGQFAPLSVGGRSFDDIVELLYGKGASPGGRAVMDGAIVDAQGGTVMLDECDKAHKSVRDALLRLLEAGEFHRPGNHEKISLDGEDHPLFVITASGNGDEGSLNRDEKDVRTRIMMESPLDFWNRVEQEVKVHSPFEGITTPDTNPQDPIDGYGDMRARTLRTFINYFLTRERVRSRSRTLSPFVADQLLHQSSENADKRIGPLMLVTVEFLTEGLLEKKLNMRIIRTAVMRVFTDLKGLATFGHVNQENARIAVKNALKLTPSSRQGMGKSAKTHNKKAIDGHITDLTRIACMTMGGCLKNPENEICITCPRASNCNPNLPASTSS